MNTERLLSIANEYGTPTYVYDLERIRTQIHTLKKSITYNKTIFFYAIKANYNPHVVRAIINQGFGIDAVSLAEVQMGLACGAKPQDIMYTESNMTDEEMDMTHQLGVLINIGSLSRLDKFGKKYPGSNVCVRFNPNVGDANHHHNITGGPESKFGISYKQVQEVIDCVKKHRLKLIGIHHHIGSGWLGLESPLKALEVILDIASQIPHLEFVDLGGGFGVPYRPNQTELDIDALGRAISDRFSEFCTSYGTELTLKLEPGRYIVCQAGHLLIGVNTVKTSPEGRVFAGTDSGMNHMIRVALYDAYHDIKNISNLHGEIHTYDICGNICESSDFFAKQRTMPEIREGDVLSIENAGAYGFAMASNYQFRSLPMEIVVDGNTIIVSRQRETFEQMFDKYETF